MAGMIAENVRAIFLQRDYELPLPRKTVSLAPDILEEYVGEYSLKDQLKLKVFIKQGKLLVNDGRHPQFEIYPQSENQFFLEGVDAEIKFTRTSEGKVSGLVLRDDGFNKIEIPKTQ